MAVGLKVMHRDGEYVYVGLRTDHEMCVYVSLSIQKELTLKATNEQTYKNFGQ